MEREGREGGALFRVFVVMLVNGRAAPEWDVREMEKEGGREMG